LGELRLPVELLATADDTMVPSRVSNSVADEVTAAHLHIIPAGGHLIHEFKPEVIASRIERMLASFEEVSA
ncbi:MAG: alpha/beta hydrolase, partial [Pseudomonadota bacterium]